MKTLKNFFKYLEVDKNIFVSSSMKESFSYCFAYFKEKENIDFLDKNAFSKDLFLTTISLSRNKFSKDLDKKFLKICNEYAKHFVEYMNEEIETDIETNCENEQLDASANYDNMKSAEIDIFNSENDFQETIYIDNVFTPLQIARDSFNKIINNISLKSKEISSGIGLTIKKEDKKTEEVGIIIFDLIRDLYFTNSNMDDDESFHSYPLPTYFSDGTSTHLMSNDGFYESDIFSTYNCFDKNYFNTSISSTLLANVFNDVNKVSKSSSFKNLCLIPDSIDEFNISFRKAIMSHNRDLFLIPQSIAFAIYIMIAYPTIKESFAIVDLDSEEPTFFEFRIENDCIVRRGRKKIDVSTTSYSKLVKSYFNEYGKKYGIDFDLKDISKIISLRLLDKIIYNKELSIPFTCLNKDIISLEYDEEIHQYIEEKIFNAEKNFQNKYRELNDSIFYISSLKNDAFTFGINTIEKAFKYILKRYREKLPLWKEEMPTIDVEVINNNKREFVQLVKPGITQDIIIGYDEDIIYDVPGLFYLRAFDDQKQVATHTDIPMKRNVVGALNTQKKAVFNYSKPLVSDVEIKMFVKYNYNNENVFNLIGRTTSGEVYESSWEDQGRIKLVSKVYAEVQKPTADEITRARTALHDIIIATKNILQNLNNGNNFILQKNLDTIADWNKRAHYHSCKAFRHSTLEKNAVLKEFLFDKDFSLDGIQYSSKICFLLHSSYIIGKNATNEILKKIDSELLEYIGKFSCIPIYAKEEKYKEIQQYYSYYLEKLSKVIDLRKGIGTMFMLSKEINNLDEDYFGIFKLIKAMVPEKYTDKLFESFTRNIAAYAWDSKTWLLTLYNLFSNTNLFNKCYHYIHHSLGFFNCIDICKHEITTSKRGVPSLSKVRDQLECALAFINIRDEENLYFNPNEPDTEELKVKLSKLSDDIQTCFKKYASISSPDKIFKSRLSMSLKNTEKTVETIYILNKALDGREVINLKYEDK